MARLSRKAGSKPVFVVAHAFALDREARRMRCRDCGGLMGECPDSCPKIWHAAEIPANLASVLAVEATAALPADPFDLMFTESFHA